MVKEQPVTTPCRQAVTASLKKKVRRNREPDAEIYQNREFIEKFFRVDNVV